MRKKLLVFDCDGVLRTFSWQDVYEAYLAICKHFDIELADFFDGLEDFKASYTHEWRVNLCALGITDERDYPTVNRIFHNVYDDRIRIFPWVGEVIEELSDFATVAVLSNSTTKSVVRTLNGSMGNIAKVIGSDLMSQMKPHPGGLEQLMREFDAAPGDTWMIGDADVDIRTGINAGTLTAGVVWGATESSEELLSLRPDKVFLSHEEIVPFYRSV